MAELRREIDERGTWEEVYSESEIHQRVVKLAEEIGSDYKGKKLLLVGVLRGAFIFTADLVRELDQYLPDLEVDFISVSSYGDGEESSRAPKFEKDLSTDIEGLDVLIVEDMVDTGFSFKKLLGVLMARNPKSLKTCVLLVKEDSREVEVPIDYKGFVVAKKWYEGFGLDSAQKRRGRKNIVKKIG